MANSDINNLIIRVDGTSLDNFVVRYDAKVVSESVGQSWGYSINGSSYTQLASELQPGALTTTWATYTVDFSSIAGLGVNPVYFKNNVSADVISMEFNNLQYDNIAVNVPEPINVALALFGLGAAGLAIARRVRAS